VYGFMVLIMSFSVPALAKCDVDCMPLMQVMVFPCCVVGVVVVVVVVGCWPPCSWAMPAWPWLLLPP
jgi:hypothetical protein